MEKEESCIIYGSREILPSTAPSLLICSGGRVEHLPGWKVTSHYTHLPDTSRGLDLLDLLPYLRRFGCILSCLDGWVPSSPVGVGDPKLPPSSRTVKSRKRSKWGRTPILFLNGSSELEFSHYTVRFGSLKV